MLFAIQNAGYSNPLYDYPVLSQKYGAYPGSYDDPWYEHALIKISSFDELIQLSREIGQDIIVKREELDGHPWLMIYDGYLE